MKQADKNKLGILVLVLLMGIPFGAVDATEGDVSESRVMERMKSAIRNYVATRLLKDPIEIDVDGLSPMLSEKKVSAQDRMEIKKGPDGEGQEGLIGRVVFLLSVKKQNGGESHHWVSAEVSVIRKVWVATRPLKRKERITNDALSVQTFYQTRLAEQYVEIEEAPWGKQTSRLILPGTPITFDMIEEAPVIRRGEQVTLMVETEGMVISAPGHAKEDGFLGRQLAVVSLVDRKKTVYGTVINASVVKVMF